VYYHTTLTLYDTLFSITTIILVYFTISATKKAYR